MSAAAEMGIEKKREGILIQPARNLLQLRYLQPPVIGFTTKLGSRSDLLNAASRILNAEDYGIMIYPLYLFQTTAFNYKESEGNTWIS